MIRLLQFALHLAVSVVIVCALPAQEAFRDFTNQSGQKLRAAIVSATDTDVVLKREDGSQVKGGISFFSQADQDYIAKWRSENQAAVNYEFDIQADKQRVSRDKATEGTLITVYEVWKYAIHIENRSKSGVTGADVDQLEVHYNLIKTARSLAKEAGATHRGLVPSGPFLVKAGKVALGTAEYLRKSDIETETIAVNVSELKPGWTYTDGSKGERKDDLEGIAVKIVRNGKVIGEKTIGSPKAATAKWVQPRGQLSAQSLPKDGAEKAKAAADTGKRTAAVDGGGKTAPIQTEEETIVIDAFLEGGSRLFIDNEKLWWAHYPGQSEPGKFGGADEPTYVNGQPWKPEWLPAPQEPYYLSKPYAIASKAPKLAANLVSVSKTRRGEPEAIRPIRSSPVGEELVIAIPRVDGDARWYRIEITPTKE